MKENKIITISSIVLLVYSYIVHDVDIALLSLSFNLIYAILYCLRCISERYLLFSFILCFFILLLSRIFLPYLIDVEALLYQSDFEIPDSIKPDVYLQLSVALCFSVIGHQLASKRNNEITISDNLVANLNILKIRKISVVFVWFTVGFYLINLFTKISMVAGGNYASLYTEDVGNGLISMVAGKFNFCMYMYFATFPPPRECKKYLALYALCNFLGILTGVRGTLVIAAIFILTYLAIRNKIQSYDSIWLSRKMIIMVIGAFPVLMFFMYVVMIIRSGGIFENVGFANICLGSIYQLGSSIEVITNTILYKDELSKQSLFSLSQFIELLVHNPISDIFLGIPRYEHFSPEYATKARDLGASLTYLDNPGRYAIGGSVGSSYVSEAWIDFGYIGIISFSLLYGYILGSALRWLNSGNFWRTFFVLTILVQIMYAPRSSASSFFVSFIETKSLPFLLIAYLYSGRTAKIKYYGQNFIKK